MCLTIGCDPELVCRLNGKFEPADRHFKFNLSLGFFVPISLPYHKFVDKGVL
jgi:hypothetical protein